MKTVAELRAAAEKALARQDELVDASTGREMTDTEKSEYEACTKTFDACMADIKRINERNEKAAALAMASDAAQSSSGDVTGTVKSVVSNGSAGVTAVTDNLTPQQHVGIFVWAAAAQKHAPVADPYSRIDQLGLTQIADRGRKVAKEYEARTKALVSISGAGANLVQAPLSSEFIDFLRNESAFLSGAPVQVEMGTGLIIPGGQNGTSGTYHAENADIGYTQATTRQVALSPKHISALTAVSNFLIETSPLAIAQIAGDDLLAGLRTGIDSAGLRGDGTGNNPTGLRNLIAAGNILVEASGSVTPSLVQVNTALKSILARARASNVPARRRRWLISSRIFTFLQFLTDGNGNLAYPSLSLPVPTLLNVPVTMSEQVPSTLGVGTNESEIYLADFGHIIMGVARALRLTTSTEASYINATSTLVSAFSKDETVIKASASHDFDVRYDTSSVIMTGVRWA